MRLASLTAFWLTVATPFGANAQHCRPASSDSADSGINVEFRAEAATYKTPRFEGSYEGIALGAGFHVSRLAVRAQLPRYRIVRNGRPDHGFGDFFGEAQLRLLRIPEASLRLGVAAAMSAPTGSRRTDLGMGHYMWMPSVWADLAMGRFSLKTKVLYAGALGTRQSPGAHVHGPSPIVAPMNASELTALIAASLRIHDVLHARAGVSSSVGLERGGTSRATALFASDFVFRRSRVALEAEVPLLGDPFSFKLASEIGIQF